MAAVRCIGTSGRPGAYTVSIRQRTWRLFWGCYILFLVGVVVLPILQSAALNSGGTARLFGINLAPPITFLARTSSQMGKTMGWESLANLYYGPDGPIVRDPLYHSAWPYWGAPLLVWGLGSILLVAVLLITLRFVRHFFLPAGEVVAMPAQPDPLTPIPPASTTMIGGIWQSLPFLWSPIDTRGLTAHDVDIQTGARLSQRGVLCAIAAAIVGAIGVSRSFTSPLVWVAVVLLILAILTLKEGTSLSRTAHLEARHDAAVQADLERQLIVLEASRQTPARDLHHQIEMLTMQQTHERRIKNLDRWHQRLLLDRRQPHEVNLKAMDLSLALAQMVAVAKSENKFDQYQKIFDQMQRQTDKMTADIQRRDLSDEEKADRVAEVTKSVVELAQRMIREL